MAFVFNSQKPLLVSMVQEETVEAALDSIATGLYDGAEAFGIQLEDLRIEERTPENLKRMFAACMGRPIYITSYRVRHSKDFTDEQCLELLLMGAEAGADLCDVMGDTFDHQPFELTFDEVAVAKQKAVIDRIHAMGKQVLISSHTHTHLSREEVLRYALAQKERGADVVKIVNLANGRDQLQESMNTIFSLKKELEDTPFLFLTGGRDSSIIRQTGPLYGVCMYLCAPWYRPGYTRQQPLLRNMKLVRDNLLYPL